MRVLFAFSGANAVRVCACVYVRACMCVRVCACVYVRACVGCVSVIVRTFSCVQGIQWLGFKKSASLLRSYCQIPGGVAH
jgi:hypothetical protein